MNVAFYADVLIERYRELGEDLDGLTDIEISLLWCEVSTGMKLLSFERFDQNELEKLTEMKPMNLRKFAKLCKLVNGRKCADAFKMEEGRNPRDHGNTANPGNASKNGKRRELCYDSHGLPVDQNQIESDKCAICGMSFPNWKSKVEHETAELCSKQCYKCFQIFSTTPKLIRHLTCVSCNIVDTTAKLDTNLLHERELKMELLDEEKENKPEMSFEMHFEEFCLPDAVIHTDQNVPTTNDPTDELVREQPQNQCTEIAILQEVETIQNNEMEIEICEPEMELSTVKKEKRTRVTKKRKRSNSVSTKSQVASTVRRSSRKATVARPKNTKLTDKSISEPETGSKSCSAIALQPEQEVNDMTVELTLVSSSCEYCLKSFASSSSLLHHQRMSHFRYSCPICKKLQIGHQTCQFHLCKAHGVSRSKAKVLLPFDSAPFDVDGERGQELLEEAALPKDCCVYCTKSIQPLTKLLHHQKMSHFKYLCPICKEPKSGLQNTQIHMEKAHNRSRAEVKLLLPWDTAPFDIAVGQKVDDTVNGPTEVCCYCAQKFYSAKDVLQHQEVNHIRYQCSKCNQSKQGIYAARRHMHRMHDYSQVEAMFMELQESGRPVEIDDPSRLEEPIDRTENLGSTDQTLLAITYPLSVEDNKAIKIVDPQGKDGHSVQSPCKEKQPIEEGQGQKPAASAMVLDSGSNNCPLCPPSIERTFSTQGRVLAHQQRVHFCYNCPICHQAKRGLFNVRTHLRKVHKKSAAEALELIPNETAVVDMVDGQRKQVTEMKNEGCSYCSKRFHSKHSLENHCRAHHVQYQCPMCNTVRRGIYNARNHIAEMHDISKRDISKMKLEVVNEVVDKMVDDVVNEVVDVTTTVVPVVDVTTTVVPEQNHSSPNGSSEIAIVKEGEKPSAGNRGMEFHCDYCPNRYRTANAKRLHVNSIHSKHRYQCPACKKLFTQEDGVKKHLVKVHHVNHLAINTLEITVECDDDPIMEPPAKRVKLATTSAVTGNDGGFKCDYCPKEFARRHEQRLHVDSVHKQVHHECPDCLQLFPVQKSLLRHMLMAHDIPMERSAKMKIRIHQGESEQRESHPPAQSQLLTNPIAAITVGECSLPNTAPGPQNNESELAPTATLIPQDTLSLTTQKTGTDQTDIRFQCPLCPATFTRKQQTVLHLTRKHNYSRTKISKLTIKQTVIEKTVTQLNEEIRSIEFDGGDGLNGDVKNRVNKEKPEMDCPVCHQSFAEEKIRKHFKDDHEITKFEALKIWPSSKPYEVTGATGTTECPLCPTAYKQPYRIYSHVKTFHKMSYKQVQELVNCSREPTITCPTCPKSFNNNRKLQVHAKHCQSQPEEVITKNEPEMPHLEEMTELEPEVPNLEVMSDIKPEMPKLELRELETPKIEDGNKYKCHLCPKQYTQSGSCNRHIKRCHPVTLSTTKKSSLPAKLSVILGEEDDAAVDELATIPQPSQSAADDEQLNFIGYQTSFTSEEESEMSFTLDHSAISVANEKLNLSTDLSDKAEPTVVANGRRYSVVCPIKMEPDGFFIVID